MRTFGYFALTCLGLFFVLGPVWFFMGCDLRQLDAMGCCRLPTRLYPLHPGLYVLVVDDPRYARH